MNTTYTLVTGATSGIGKELATIAASKGHNVVLIARDKEVLNALGRTLTKRYDVYTEVIACDLTDHTSPQKIFDILARKKITVDVLINNAGVGDYGDFVHSNLGKQLALIDLNIRALTELTHLFLQGMIQRKQGQIMNLGSVASFLPGPLMSTYFASKAFVLSFSEALSEELRGSGVTVTCLCPGSTKTSFGETAQVSTTHSTRTSQVTSEQVAAFGWEAMNAGDTVAIYGVGNKLSVVLSKFLPRSLLARLVKHIQK